MPGMDPFVGQIMAVPYNFAPFGWAFCNGQLMSISQNTALFSLLGTNFGGDGKSTFGLPNLQGLVAVHSNNGSPGPGLSPVDVGEIGGTAAVTLTALEMPSHSHNAMSHQTQGSSGTPAGLAWAKDSNDALYQSSANGTMSAAATSTVGGGQSHTNLMPYLVLNYIIALQGVFPARG
jgi:microcystin-dependent protein